MPFQLAIAGPQQAPRTVMLRSGVNLVGRAGRLDVVLAGTLVSRTHAKLVVDPAGTVQLFDLDSHNGVFVNGEKVRTRAVHVGEHIYVGGFRLTLEPSEGAGPQAAGESLSKLAVPPMTLAAVDAARRAEPHAFEGRDAAARNLAALARAVEKMGGALSTHGATDALLGLMGETLKCPHVALLTVAPGNMLALAQTCGSLPGEPPLAWPVLKRAQDQKAMFFSRDAPVEEDLVGRSVLGEPAALLVLPLLTDGGDKVLGMVQLLRAFSPGGFTAAEVDTGLVLAHLCAAQLASPPRTGASAAEAGGAAEDVTVTATAPSADASGLRADALRAALVRSMPEALADQVLATASGRKISGVPQAADQVMVAYDLMAFEPFSAGKPSEEVARVVGGVAHAAASVASAFGGQLDKVDAASGLMRFVDGGIPDASEAAVRAAMELRDRVAALVGDAGLTLRAGVDAGRVLAGVFADGERPTYTVVGAAARVAERLAELALAGEVYVSQTVRAALQPRGWRLVGMGPHALRGRSEVVDLFRVDGAPEGAA